MKHNWLLLFLWLLLGCEPEETTFSNNDFEKAFKNSKLANQALCNSYAYLQGWLLKIDDESGLIPRNLFDDKNIWNAKDAAADNYPRHREYLHLPQDYARINQFQEWFTVKPAEKVKVISSKVKIPYTYNGNDRIPISFNGGDSLKIVIIKI